MTMQAEQLMGARVTGADGKVVGTVELVFNDDVDGTPAWARVRSGKAGRFVPLRGSRVTPDGLAVPFDSQKIISGPEIAADRHMSAAQAEQLSRYYGLIVPAQGGPDSDTAAGTDKAGSDKAGSDKAGGDKAGRTGTDMAAGTRTDTAAGTGSGMGGPADTDWLIRSEERVDLGKEMRESGRVRLHKYVDVEPVEQAVHVYHEEYEIERTPITPADQVSSEIGEGQQEIILHEEQVFMRKEAVPVERVRLVTRRVAEDRTVRDEIRKERIELEDQDAGIRAGAQRPS
ncbi:MAG: YsnF/AvaK domain-containing protein [Streptosporangiaceae bacterium]